MFIYRVENLKGDGPYTSISFNLWARRNHDTLKHPEPCEDGITVNMYDKEWKCGFISLEQLYNWFNKEELRRLRKLGYNIVKIKIYSKYVKKGNKQLVFKKDKEIVYSYVINRNNKRSNKTM